MPSSGPRYPDEEFARRGKEIYSKIKHLVDEGNHGKILAIDIETGEYEVDESDIVAVDRLFARLPDPQVFCLRIGYRTVLRFRGPSAKKAS
jgi:hypothetical protein